MNTKIDSEELVKKILKNNKIEGCNLECTFYFYTKN